MKPIRRASMESILDRTIREWRETGGWTSNFVVYRGWGSIYLQENESLSRLHEATKSVVIELKPKRMILFHDDIAAWKTKWRGNRGYEFSDINELISFIDREIYFRDPERYEDNYNIIDDTGDWMLTYCHHDNWFLVAKNALLQELNKTIKAEICLGPHERNLDRGGV